METTIREYFKKNKLPKALSIKHTGKWAKGECYAVTCGVFKLKKYVVYCIGNEIQSVRQRGV